MTDERTEPTPLPEGSPAAPGQPAPQASFMAQPRVVRRRDWVPSLIWLLPIVAALVGVTLVAKALWNQGPEITLSFRTAEGLEPGKTAVKYKDVQIGMVKSLRLASDRSQVLVTVQLDKDASEGFVAEDARFWVVRPRLDTTGISGLGTLLSGAYIGADAGVSERSAEAFEGLEAPPIVTRDARGRQFVLRADDVGSLDIGSPIYYRRIKVGQVSSLQLDEDGKAVTLRIFVNEPFDRFVGANTRFWHASGVDLHLGAGGVTLRTQSLATIMIGGIAFRTPDDLLGDPALPETTFALAAGEREAMKEPDGPAQTLLLYFNQSLRGLSPGAPVDFRGVVMGEVKSIGVQFDRAEREFRMPVLVTIYPDRLHRASVNANGRHNDPAQRFTQIDRLRFLIERGMRAQLRTGNLLTGQNYVALDFFPKEKPIKVNTEQVPIELPTVANSLDEIQSQVQEIATKINRIPFDELASDARRSLATLNSTLAEAERTVASIRNDVTPEMAAALKDARKTLDTAGRTLAEDAPLQQDLRQTLQELTRTAASVRVLTDYLERHPESLLRGKPKDPTP